MENKIKHFKITCGFELTLDMVERKVPSNGTRYWTDNSSSDFISIICRGVDTGHMAQKRISFGLCCYLHESYKYTG
jgi:hypothetical protein